MNNGTRSGVDIHLGRKEYASLAQIKERRDSGRPLTKVEKGVVSLSDTLYSEPCLEKTQQLREVLKTLLRGQAGARKKKTLLRQTKRKKIAQKKSDEAIKHQQAFDALSSLGLVDRYSWCEHTSAQALEARLSELMRIRLLFLQTDLANRKRQTERKIEALEKAIKPYPDLVKLLEFNESPTHFTAKTTRHRATIAKVRIMVDKLATERLRRQELEQEIIELPNPLLA